MSPSRSAPSIIASAMRSFIEPVGLRYSSLIQSSAPFAGAQRRRRTSGVFPIDSSTDSTDYRLGGERLGAGFLRRRCFRQDLGRLAIAVAVLRADARKAAG